MNREKYLNLSFKTERDGSSTIRVPKVKDDVTAEEIQSCAKAIIDENIFRGKEGDLIKFKGAKIITTETEEVDFNQEQ